MKKKFICTVCGYVHEGNEAPEKCPQCGAPRSKFKELDETALLQFVTEHEIGAAKGSDDEMIKDLTAHFNGECTEVGMYLAMSRQAQRRMGVGSALIQYLIEKARRTMGSRILLDVRESNLPARAFYETQGFLEDGIRRNYYDTPREDAVLMSYRVL